MKRGKSRGRLGIKDMPKIDRPREKLAKAGPDALCNTELLAVILGSGTKKQDVMNIAGKLLKKYGANNLKKLSLSELKKNDGIGRTKACQLVAMFEFCRRTLSDHGDTEDNISCPQDVYNLTKEIRKLKKEHFVVLYLNAKNWIIKKETVSIGTLNASLVHPREVFEPAVGASAANIILAHNHPSGDLEPSQDDIDLSERLIESGRIMGIEVLDHIIVSVKGFLSMKEKNLI